MDDESRPDRAPLPGPASTPTGDAKDSELFQRVLELARLRLGMEIAWLSRFEHGAQVFEHVAADEDRIRPGSSSPLADSYCIRVVDGRLPGAVPDARSDERTADLLGTHDLGIGAYAGAPVQRADGELYGMLCCTSRGPRPTLGDSDIAFLEILATLVGEELDRRAEDETSHRRAQGRIRAAIDGGMTMVFQPLMDLRTGQVSGCEALARFDDGTRPDLRFAEAAAVGLELDLEVAAIEAAIAEATAHLPAGTYLSVNASPELLVSGRLEPLFESIDPSRLVIEITEHAPVTDYGTLLETFDRVRARGARLAVDDAGAGFASMNHILRLWPDIVKLDIALTRDIHRDPVRRALAGALVRFCADTGASLVAEGVENQDELDALLALGFTYAQGFFLGRPGPLPLPVQLPQPTAHGLDATERRPRAGTGITGSTDLEAFCRSLLEDVLEITGFDVGYVALRRPDSDLLEQRYVTGRGDLLPMPRLVPWKASLCAACRARGLLWTADVHRDLPGSAMSVEVRSFMSVPFQDDVGVDIGSVCAIAAAPRYLSATMLDDVRAISARIGDWISRVSDRPVPLFLDP